MATQYDSAKVHLGKKVINYQPDVQAKRQHPCVKDTLETDYETCLKGKLIKGLEGVLDCQPGPLAGWNLDKVLCTDNATAQSNMDKAESALGTLLTVRGCSKSCIVEKYLGQVEHLTGTKPSPID
jgi:hypothetical protein